MQKIIDVAQNPTVGLTKSASMFLSKLITNIHNRFKDGRFDPSFENNELSDFKNKVMNKIALSIAVNGNKNNFINELRADTLSDNYIKEFKTLNTHIDYQKGRTIYKDSSNEEMTKKILKNNINKTTDDIYNVFVANIDNKKTFLINAKRFSRVMKGDKQNKIGIIKNSGGLEKTDFSNKYFQKTNQMANSLVENLLITQNDLKRKSNLIKNKRINTAKEINTIADFLYTAKENRTSYVFSKYQNFGKIEQLMKATNNVTQNILKNNQQEIKHLLQQTYPNGIKGIMINAGTEIFKNGIKEGKNFTENTKILSKTIPTTVNVAFAVEQNVKKLQQAMKSIIDSISINGSGEDFISQVYQAQQINKNKQENTQKAKETVAKIVKTIVTKKP